MYDLLTYVSHANFKTERGIRVGCICFVIRSFVSQVLTQKLPILTECFRGFPQFLKHITVYQIKSFASHY
jgi:hypothetical protein